MRKRETIVITFVLLVVLFFLLSFFSKTKVGNGTRGIFEKILSPFQSIFLSISKVPQGFFQNQEEAKLQEENKSLLSKLSEFEKLKADNAALRDQFQSSTLPNEKLLPAEIIGMPAFIPALTEPEEIILDKGSEDNVLAGFPVVLKNQVLGKISRVSSHRSVVMLISSKNSSFTAKASQTGALGVLKGEGNGEMILDNVLLSDSLKIGDTVVTKGDQNEKGLGFPADLLVGKIISLDKRASNVFQQAKIKSLIDIPKLSVVFIIFP